VDDGMAAGHFDNGVIFLFGDRQLTQSADRVWQLAAYLG
jgi:hypothetical protein